MTFGPTFEPEPQKDDNPAEIAFTVAIPSGGHRPELLALVERVLEELPALGQVVVGASGERALPKVRTLLAPLRSHPALSIVAVPLGYASARNQLIAVNLERTKIGFVFIDDDVHLFPGALRTLLTYAREKPDVLFSGTVERRIKLNDPLGALLYAPMTTACPKTLPANFLFVGRQHLLDGCDFPRALDLVGGEDTALTHSLHQQGVQLVRLEGVGGWEDHTDRPHAAVILRLVASTAVWTMLKRDQNPREWSSRPMASTLIRFAWWMALRALSVPVVPAAIAFRASKGVGVLLAHCGILPRCDTAGVDLLRVSLAPKACRTDQVGGRAAS